MHDARAAFLASVHVHADHAYEVYTDDLFVSHCGGSHACAGRGQPIVTKGGLLNARWHGISLKGQRRCVSALATVPLSRRR